MPSGMKHAPLLSDCHIFNRLMNLGTGLNIPLGSESERRKFVNLLYGNGLHVC